MITKKAMMKIKYLNFSKIILTKLAVTIPKNYAGIVMIKKYINPFQIGHTEKNKDAASPINSGIRLRTK